MVDKLLDDKPVREAIVAGLDRVADLTPTHGYLEGKAGVRGDWLGGVNPFARVELGHRFNKGITGFVYGEADRMGWQAGAGLRVEW